MKLILLLLIPLFISCEIKQDTNSSLTDKSLVKDEMEKSEALDNYGTLQENIFPIAQLDLTEIGLDRKLFIAYVFFDPNIEDKLFPKNQNQSNYSFKVNPDGRLSINFHKKALEVSEDNDEFLIESIEQYNNYMAGEKQSYQFEFYDEPIWWQNSQTPKTKTGEDCKFLCQTEMYDIVDQDCMAYFFYDLPENLVRVVIQWD